MSAAEKGGAKAPPGWVMKWRQGRPMLSEVMTRVAKVFGASGWELGK